MLEFDYFDGTDTTTMDIIDRKTLSIGKNGSREIITIAVTHMGKISVCDYEIFEDKYGQYIEHGPLNDQIYLDEFEFVD